MKRFNSLLSFLLILVVIYYSFSSLMPKEAAPSSIDKTLFSAERALVPLKEITKAPHYLGTKEHERVRNYLVSELKKLGLQPEVQEGFVLNTKWKSLDKSKNIIAKIKGTGNTKALLVFSHYDSAPISSYGAGDAGSGVVTILEGIRAYLASGKKPKNDIIILFTDAEELGLDGARLFVNEHPWAKDVGIAINFEARGSGGPGNMIVETNQGNKNLIKGFIEANPDYPVASSLMYSIYKKLPNDTDSTVFREDGDIDGFFFAFIDDHYDYHTANDNFKNLDRNTLQHQGENLLPLLHYFADADLSQLKSNEDSVYINFPFVKMISYPFSWIKPMFFIALLIFLFLIFIGLKKGKLTAKGIIRGLIAFFSSLIINGLIGYFGWKLLQIVYPQYQEIQHGFTYNGHTYIAFFVALTLSLTFLFYRKFSKKITVTNLLVAPILFWLLLNGFITFSLQGASFFIIPVYFALLAFWVLIKQEVNNTKRPNIYLMLLLSVSAIFIFAPLVKFLPVGLGLKMLVGSTIFTVLLFGLLLPVIGFYKSKRAYAVLFFAIAFVLFVKAHRNSGFTPEHQKPNSLVYFEDADTGNSYWATYDKILDPWTKGYLGNSPEEASKYISLTSGSKYKRAYTYANKAPRKNIPIFQVEKNKDTVVNNLREVTFTLLPQRKVNLISLYSNTLLDKLQFNGRAMPNDTTKNKKFTTNELVRYFVTDGDSLEVSYRISPNTPVNFTVVEYSFDLLNNPLFTIAKRPDYTMPKPFVITDAVIVKKTIEPQLLAVKKNDTIYKKL